MLNIFEQEEVKRSPIPMRLQFFAEDGEGSEGNDEGTGDQDNGDQNQDDKSGEVKTFTQEDLNKMMKAEKESGKRSILKGFGFKDEKEAKSFMEKAKALIESQKTEEEKKAEKEALLEKEKNEAIKKATYLENKFLAVSEGARADVLDDLLAIALLRVTEDKDLKTVLTELKTNTAFAGFFGEYEEFNKGTGTGIGSKGGKGTGAVKGLGARLAQQNKPTEAKKSAYFSK